MVSPSRLEVSPVPRDLLERGTGLRLVAEHAPSATKKVAGMPQLRILLERLLEVLERFFRFVLRGLDLTEAGRDPRIFETGLLRFDKELRSLFEFLVVEREVRGDELLVRSERAVLAGALEHRFRACVIACPPQELSFERRGDL